jgi:hypothetical protein
MRPLVTRELLRGILVAYVACYCYWWSMALWSSVFPRFLSIYAGASTLALAIYIMLFLCLLFPSATATKVAFVFIALLCLLQIGPALYWLSFPTNTLHRPPALQLYRSLFISLAIAPVTYFYYRGRVPHGTT